MSLLQREVRTLSRDKDAEIFRDDRLFLVACDDTYAPPQYFDLLKLPRVKIVVVPTKDGTSTANRVLERLVAAARELELDEDDERWMVLDTDHFIQGTHQAGFVAALRDAKQKNVKVALSRPCFEVWLLLHHVHESQVNSLETCNEVIAALRTNVGEYSKTNLRAEHYPNGSAVEAAIRAERLDGTVSGGEIPASTTTRVYLLLKAIAAKGLPSQHPPELRGLRS